MNLPRFHHRFLIFIAVLIPIFGFGQAMHAQPPSPPGAGPWEPKKPPVSRVRPQIIYNVPRVSGNAAALHAQAKADHNALPIDSNMPISLQVARAAANAEAAQSPPPAANTSDQNGVVRQRVHRPRQKAQKGNPRSFSPGKGARGRGPGFGGRGGGGRGKKK